MDVSCKCSVSADKSLSILSSDKSTLELLYPNSKNVIVLVPISMIIGTQQLQGSQMQCWTGFGNLKGLASLVFKVYSYSFH